MYQKYISDLVAFYEWNISRTYIWNMTFSHVNIPLVYVTNSLLVVGDWSECTPTGLQKLAGTSANSQSWDWAGILRNPQESCRNTWGTIKPSTTAYLLFWAVARYMSKFVLFPLNIDQSSLIGYIETRFKAFCNTFHSSTDSGRNPGIPRNSRNSGGFQPESTGIQLE